MWLQSVTLQVLDVGIEQMPRGKLHDQPYPPALLGTADGGVSESDNSPGAPAPRQQSQDMDASRSNTAAARHGRSAQEVSQNAAGQQEVRVNCSQQHQGHVLEQSQRDCQQQSVTDSQITLTQPGTAAEVTSGALQSQQVPQQQCVRQQTQQQQLAGKQGTSMMAAVNGSSSNACSPASNHGKSASPSADGHTPWTPVADFDVHSILEVAPMRLLQDFLVGMAQVVRLT